MTDSSERDGLPSTFDDGALYDLVVGGIEYGLDFYVDLARKANGPVLDVACGTGRILIPCMQHGVDIEGLDLYQAMLDRCRENAASAGVDPVLHRADMCDFSISRQFALVMIPFNAFIHNMTQESQIDCLATCRRHLESGGRLVIDTFFPSLEIVGAEQNTRVLEGETPHPQSGLPMRMYDTRTFDRVAQRQDSLNELEILDVDGKIVETHRSQVSSRYIYKHEMALLLRVAGYKRWEIYGDFDQRPLVDEDSAMIVSAWNE